jgi:hypothetical protein
MALHFGPLVSDLATRYYARFGQWPETLRLMLRGAPVPDEIVQAGEKLREVWKREQLFREAKLKDSPEMQMVIVHVNGEQEVLRDW